MTPNPFLTKTFVSVWSKYFNAKKRIYNFNSIKDVSFYKALNIPLYCNIGKNITNGMSYQIAKQENDFKGRAFLIYDVPSYFNLKELKHNNLKRFKVKQYKGFLTDLQDFESYDAFAKKQFKSNTRYKFRRNIQRLETCFNIHYNIYNEAMDKAQYDVIMKGFKNLLTKRFNELQKSNDILETWEYYYDLIYKMLKKKCALLITITNNDKPIGVSLSFLSNTTMFYAVTSFDTDYYRFNLGHTTIIKLFQWCFDNGYTIYDFSKGEYEYKNRWTNHEYVYENHIIYDSKNIIASTLAKYIKLKYELKQYLRDKNVNDKYVKLKFLLKGKKPKTTRRTFKIEKHKQEKATNGLQLIDLSNIDYAFLKPIVYDELYKSPEHILNIKIYKYNSVEDETYYVKGKKNNFTITFS
ncbi:GNAT family N-acetyltransferase [Mangrovimonas cancribranchiae]|uniref:GNAT family N-acetyltransferase n=1 Tax=Mangrovimonas cancribranchiae TaxID=3080055 RepID=A0AAU6PBK3_9FLAO